MQLKTQLRHNFYSSQQQFVMKKFMLKGIVLPEEINNILFAL